MSIRSAVKSQVLGEEVLAGFAVQLLKVIAEFFTAAEDAIEPLIVEKAQSYRKENPGLGCSKLYLIVKKLFEENSSGKE